MAVLTPGDWCPASPRQGAHPPEAGAFCNLCPEWASDWLRYCPREVYYLPGKSGKGLLLLNEFEWFICISPPNMLMLRGGRGGTAPLLHSWGEPCSDITFFFSFLFGPCKHDIPYTIAVIRSILIMRNANRIQYLGYTGINGILRHVNTLFIHCFFFMVYIRSVAVPIAIFRVGCLLWYEDEYDWS